MGQNLYEEIDLVEKGKNYGWVIREGMHCFDPFNPNTPPLNCDTTGLTDPVAEYDHGVGIAVVAGFVHRAAWPPVAFGKYFFADFSTSFASPDGHLFYIEPDVDWSVIKRIRLGADNHALNLFVKGIGRDGMGELYLLTSSSLGPAGTNVNVWRMAVRCPSDFDRNGFVNGDDFDAFVGLFVAGDAGADWNHDTFVNGDDFDGFSEAFGGGC